MGRRQEIERLLIVELNQARTAYELGQAFSEVVENTPSGQLRTDGAPIIERSGEVDVPTMQAWITALHEFSGFVLHGTVPD